MLEREDEIRERLKETKNIEDYIKYVCVGNYIDFGVTGNIDDQMLENLLNKVNDLNISKQEVKYLEEELKDAKTLLYITDNCGEIVLDKIFIEELKKRYKNLEMIVRVRGGLAINDATIEDADLFLCKCELFTTRFGVQLFDPIFCKEERLEIKNK